ncbi:F-box/kelch-repeat protein [Trifolium repens]|nr:F-box/kelch-repeat protein [Trifolium repens]
MSMTLTLMILPEYLITEVLSFLPVKCLLRFRCVSMSWNTLILDPAFVKLHLNRSTRNQHFTLVTFHATDIPGDSPDGSDCHDPISGHDRRTGHH